MKFMKYPWIGMKSPEVKLKNDSFTFITTHEQTF